MTQKIKNLPERDKLGPLIAQFRKRAGLTQADASVMLGVAESTVAQWEQDYKRVQPWALDMMTKAYALDEYEGFLLFYEAGYALYDTPPAFLALLRQYAQLAPAWRATADKLLQGVFELLEVWREHSRSLGIAPPKRTIPSLEEMDAYWEERKHNRYHTRRIQRRIAPGP